MSDFRFTYYEFGQAALWAEVHDHLDHNADRAVRYEIELGDQTGLGQRVYIVCTDCKARRDITDYSAW